MHSKTDSISRRSISHTKYLLKEPISSSLSLLVSRASSSLSSLRLMRKFLVTSGFLTRFFSPWLALVFFILGSLSSVKRSSVLKILPVLCKRFAFSREVEGLSRVRFFISAVFIDIVVRDGSSSSENWWGARTKSVSEKGFDISTTIYLSIGTIQHWMNRFKSKIKATSSISTEISIARNSNCHKLQLIQHTSKFDKPNIQCCKAPLNNENYLRSIHVPQINQGSLWIILNILTCNVYEIYNLNPCVSFIG